MINGLRVFFKSVRGFFADGGVMMAGSLSFYFIMSFVPFSMFLIGIIGSVLGEYEGFYRFFTAKFSFFFPSLTGKSALQLKRVLSPAHSKNLSLVLYVIFSSGFFMSMEKALNQIFKIKTRRTFPVSFLMAMVVITSIVAIVLFSFVLTYYEPLADFLAHTLKWHSAAALYEMFLKYIVPFSLALAITAVLYYILPVKKINFRQAFSGALFASVMFEIAKHVFALYIRGVTVIGEVYGPLTVFVVFLMWVFYSSCIFLLGAEIAHNISGKGGWR